MHVNQVELRASAGRVEYSSLRIAGICLWDNDLAAAACGLSSAGYTHLRRW